MPWQGEHTMNTKQSGPDRVEQLARALLALALLAAVSWVWANGGSAPTGLGG